MGENQAVYIEVTDVPIGDELEVAYCSLAGGTQVVAQPQCASEIPGAVPTPTSLQYQYGAVTTNQTILAIPTEFDPDVSGAQPIVSQTSDQLFLQNNATGSFFCDNASNPCAVEIMDIPQNELQDVIQDGLPPATEYSAVGHTAIFPLTFNQGGNGCASSPLMQVDASYSVEQFLPAAGAATCTGAGGVAVLPTELPSVDDPGCATGSGAHCPISDVINGTVPATFTDDPEDPATLAELKQAGGKFAYIPIAVSGTEIAFSGAAGVTVEGNSTIFPLQSYDLTPAQAAGIMTQLWSSPVAGLGTPNDDVCGQLSGAAQCTEAMQTSQEQLLAETTNGSSANLAVSQAGSVVAQNLTFSTYAYGSPDNFAQGVGQVIGGEKIYYGDTGYALLNPWPFSYPPGSGTAVNEQNLGAMWPSTGSGATYEGTAWMCDAPNTPYTVNLPFGGQASVHDIFSGQQIVTDAEQDPVAAPGNTEGLAPGIVFQRVLYPTSECQGLSTLPTDFNNQQAEVNGLYQPSSSPLTAAHAVLGATSKYAGSGGFAFTAMDSSEANFYGLLPASLQNAAGSFVGPSATSVTAAINDATTNPDGTITPNFNDTSDSAAYPMPMVTYALVSTSPQPTAAQAAQLKDLLTNLVTYSSNGGTTSQSLPAGYFAMPSGMYSQALADISKDIVGPSGASGSGASTEASGGGAADDTGAAALNSSGLYGALGIGTAFGFGSGYGTKAATSAADGGSPVRSSGGSPLGNFVGHLLAVTLGDNRFLVPGLLILALFCLIAGPMIYMSPKLRKPRAVIGIDEDPEDSLSGPGPPD